MKKVIGAKGWDMNKAQQCDGDCSDCGLCDELVWVSIEIEN